ncbi:PREDICTED: NADPH:adrenodoxin oxidoreductase, mitochondrial [Nicrophorus vespilloides]|uniref:NADPH:adrenodoxin oxidoreductase, mitochondrial n=1 Tax=Nicrophorus vespilloides TaxID=110193 RepID=A0ABM1MDE0_NICVS|nr:PREDICTED: NADPH:adrenodoxin oxidoreductase, mitochondrial [Nicrophorus vespilloides]
MKKNILNIVKKSFSTNTSIKSKVCVVGAGPAGFYAAQVLSRKLPEAQIDIYERLPVPFGLVRFGVAPDHPEVKNVVHTFTKTAEQQNVRFLGNVDVGKDIDLKDLKEAYHSVLLAYGADESKYLNIPGEKLKNVLSARNLVGWYNGTPWDKDLPVDLSNPNVAIFGQGNVAIDIARILLTPIDILKKTDITEVALNHLASSKVKTVYLVGRRGPLQAAFTIKELREMTKLENCKSVWNENDFVGVEEIIPELQRPRKRLTELMLKSMRENKAGEKAFIPKFFRSPLEFQGAEAVEKVKLGVNKMEGSDFRTQRASLTDEVEYLDCGMAVTSIGYKSVSIDAAIPFDDKKGTVEQKNFKVSDGLYACGWLATGPTGVILTTMNNAFNAAGLMIEEVNDLLTIPKPGFESIGTKLKENNVQVVEWKDWLKIDQYEEENGKSLGKPREKIVDVQKMLEIAH